MLPSATQVKLRTLKTFYKETKTLIQRNTEFIKAILLLIKRDKSLSFHSRGRDDQSGARIHDELMAASFCYANKLKYYGPTYKQLSFNDETISLRKMLGLPSACIENQGVHLPSEIYRERHIAGFFPILVEKFISLVGIKLNSHPDTIFNQDFIHVMRQRANIDITPIKNKVVLHLRRGDVSSELYPNRYTGIDYYLNIISELSAAEPSFQFLIHSQAKGLSGKEIDALSRVGNLILDSNLCQCWEDMINAEILVLAKSSFSYVPALYSKGTVLYQPFWHSKKLEWIDVDTVSIQSAIEEVRRKRESQISGQG